MNYFFKFIEYFFLLITNLIYFFFFKFSYLFHIFFFFFFKKILFYNFKYFNLFHIGYYWYYYNKFIFNNIFYFFNSLYLLNFSYFCFLIIKKILFIYFLSSYFDFILIFYLFFLFIFFINNTFLFSVFLLPDIFFIIIYFTLFLLYIYLILKVNLYKKFDFKINSSKFEFNFISIPVSDYFFNLFYKLTILFLIFNVFILFFLLYYNCVGIYVYGQGLLFTSSLQIFLKIVLILIFLLCSFYKKEWSYFFKVEYYFLLYILIFFLSFIINSYNFLIFFTNLECITLITVILISSSSKSNTSFNSTITYFIVNSFSTILILLAISFLFGYFGTFSYKLISILFLLPFNKPILDLNISISLLLLFSGIFFKLIIFPYNFWVFEVYENIPFNLMVFLLSSSKIIFFFTVFYFYTFIFFNKFIFLKILFSIIGTFSMIISVLLSLNQFYFRRFLIASSMVNSSILLLSFLPLSLSSLNSFFIYLIIDTILFSFFSIFTFLVMTLFTKDKLFCFSLYDLNLINSIFLRFVLSLFVISISGIPPFSIFFLKYNILQSFLSSGSFFYHQ